MLFKTTVLGGAYLREIVGRMATKAAKNHIFLEPRVSIYARKPSEWHELAGELCCADLSCAELCCDAGTPMWHVSFAALMVCGWIT